MVKNAGRFHFEVHGDSEVGEIIQDPGYIRREDPPDRAALLERFQIWVQNTAGEFDDVLDSWVQGRLEMRLAVNPGLQDPNERPRKTPTKKFREALEAVFNLVRKNQADERRKKKAKKKPRR